MYRLSEHQSLQIDTWGWNWHFSPVVKKFFSSDKFFVPLFRSILVWILFFSTKKLLIISDFTK